MKTEVFIHPMAEVKTNQIGSGTTIWQCAIVLEGTVIGERCNINAHTFIEDEVIIGNDVTIGGVYIWNRTGLKMKFLLDQMQLSQTKNILDLKFFRCLRWSDFKKGAIGANATILPTLLEKMLWLVLAV